MLVAHPNRKLTPEQVLAIRSSTLGTKTLARQYQINPRVMHRIREGFTYKDCPWPEIAPERLPKFIRHTRKLTHEQVRAIRERAKVMNMAAAGKPYGASSSVVRYILLGRTYKEVI